jgi:hypothetical protein
MLNYANVESIMNKQGDAYNERNLEKFLDCFAEDIEFFRLEDNSRDLSGKNELRKAFEKLFNDFPDLNLKIKNRIVCGNYVTDLEVIHGTAKYKNGGEVISINFIENGLIRKIWFSKPTLY